MANEQFKMEIKTLDILFGLGDDAIRIWCFARMLETTRKWKYVSFGQIMEDLDISNLKTSEALSALKRKGLARVFSDENGSAYVAIMEAGGV